MTVWFGVGLIVYLHLAILLVGLICSAETRKLRIRVKRPGNEVCEDAPRPQQRSQQRRMRSGPGHWRATIACAAQSCGGLMRHQIEGGRVGCPGPFSRRDRATDRDTKSGSGPPAQTPPTPKPQSQISGVLGACRHNIDKKLSMLLKSFVFNCPEGATFSERSLRKSLDTSPLTLRILFVEMAAQQSASRKKGKEWLILARGASPGRNTQSECLGVRHGAMPSRG